MKEEDYSTFKISWDQTQERVRIILWMVVEGNSTTAETSK
jgi:hypothetical protein